MTTTPTLPEVLRLVSDEVTVCCARKECGGECGNEWHGMMPTTEAMHEAVAWLRANGERVAGLEAEVERLRRDLAEADREMQAVWDGVQRVSPWSPSNDMLWSDEVMTGVGLLAQELNDLRAARDAAADLDNDDRRDDADFWWNVAAFRGIELTSQIERDKTAESELARAREDSARLDYIERTFSGMTNSERYLPVQMIWGKGANGRTLRETCDKYMTRDAARSAVREGGANEG